MPARLYLDQTLSLGEQLTLPGGPSRHVQVLRLQPGEAVTLFNGQGGEWSARILAIGRSTVQVEVESHHTIERELSGRVTLALGMPANERMDGLIEKATELGAARVQPLVCERSVLRLAGERAQKKVEHWRGVAVAASEQSGRTRVPHVAEVLSLRNWLAGLGPAVAQARFVLSLRDAPPLRAAAGATDIVFLSGPEGGLTEAEQASATAAGFTPVSLGPRTLRADTAPLAALAAIAFASADAG
jgi:16S rRNA (uracil1498-N3)-methyltransferase